MPLSYNYSIVSFSVSQYLLGGKYPRCRQVPSESQTVLNLIDIKRRITFFVLWPMFTDYLSYLPFIPRPSPLIFHHLPLAFHIGPKAYRHRVDLFLSWYAVTRLESLRSSPGQEAKHDLSN